MLTENPYLRDAPYFFKRALRAIAEGKEEDAYSFALDLALATERAMKGLLWNANPVFTLMETGAENAIAALYSKFTHPEAAGFLKEKPNADSITFRLAASRARLFSKTVHSHLGVLMKLNYYRDIIAHCDLNSIPSAEVADFVRRNAHPLISGFIEEGLFEHTAFDPHADKLEEISISLIADLKKRMELRLSAARKRFGKKKPADLRAAKAWRFPGLAVHEDVYQSDTECPACHQSAKLRMIVDFDYADGQVIPEGSHIDKFHCPFCGLTLEDYEEMNFLGIEEQVEGIDFDA